MTKVIESVPVKWLFLSWEDVQAPVVEEEEVSLLDKANPQDVAFLQFTTTCKEDLGITGLLYVTRDSVSGNSSPKLRVWRVECTLSYCALCW
jgi:hypothetical protein